jgi:hypothetical protein
MSKALSLIVGLVELAAGIVTLNPGLIVAGVATTAAGVATLLRKAPRPPTAFEAVKTERPARFSAYAVHRMRPVTIPHR